MSISNLLVQQVYAANGVTTTFAIPFAFLDGDAELVTKVYLVNTTTGAKTLQTLVADYTLPHDVGTEPSEVLFGVAPATAQDVLVTRVLELSQAIEFLNSGQMLLDNIEEGMDILTQLLQQINEVSAKSMRLHEIQLVSAFDPVFPPTMGGLVSRAPITNVAGDGWEVTSLWPTANEIRNAQTYALAALASQVAAAASEAAASGYANNALTSQVAAAASAVAALASQVAAAASAVAAAASAAAAAAAGSSFLKLQFAYTDFQTASLTNSLTIQSLLASQMLRHIIVKPQTTFAGTAITVLTLQVGILGDLGKFIDNFDLLAVASSTNFEIAEAAYIDDWLAAKNILVTLTAVGANLSALTAGALDIQYRTINMGL